MSTTELDQSWPQWQYRASLVRCKDGDTAVLSIDAGFDVHINVPVRIVGYDAPELHGPEAVAGRNARDYLVYLLTGTPLYVRTLRDERSFERYLATVYVLINGRLTDVAEIMTAKGYVKQQEAQP